MSNVCCRPPPHAPTETATWPKISDAAPIPDSAYDFTSTPGEVLDKQTCLVWKRYPLGDSGTKVWEKHNWDSAKSACAGLGNRWRLPTQVELDLYLNNTSDVQLFGVLVRDVEPNVDDVRVRVEKLGNGCPAGTHIALLALYLPIGAIGNLAAQALAVQAEGGA